MNEQAVQRDMIFVVITFATKVETELNSVFVCVLLPWQNKLFYVKLMR